MACLLVPASIGMVFAMAEYLRIMQEDAGRCLLWSADCDGEACWEQLWLNACYGWCVQALDAWMRENCV